MTIVKTGVWEIIVLMETCIPKIWVDANCPALTRSSHVYPPIGLPGAGLFRAESGGGLEIR